jgi:hypothetical protein
MVVKGDSTLNSYFLRALPLLGILIMRRFLWQVRGLARQSN